MGKMRGKIFFIFLTLILLNINLAITEEFGYNLLEPGEGLNPGTNFSIQNVNRSEWWRTNEGDLDNVADISHSWLSDLNWASAGHTIDANIDANQYSFLGVFNWTSADDWNIFTGTVLSFNATKLSTSFFNASTIQTITGTEAGSIGLIQAYDNSPWNISEVESDFEFIVNFTGITDFNQLIIRYKSTEEDLNHVPVVQIYDWEDSDWKDYGTLPAIDVYSVVQFGVFDTDEHIGTGANDGVVRVRVYQDEPAPFRTHEHNFDWLTIAKGFGTPSGQEVDPLAIHKDGTVRWEGNEDGDNYNTTNWDYGNFNILNVSAKDINETYLLLGGGNADQDVDITGYDLQCTDLRAHKLIAEASPVAFSTDALKITDAVDAVYMDVDAKYDLGRSSNQWRNLFLMGNISTVDYGNFNFLNLSGNDINSTYLLLSGANADQNIDVSPYNLTMGGSLALEGGNGIITMNDTHLDFSNNIAGYDIKWSGTGPLTFNTNIIFDGSEIKAGQLNIDTGRLVLNSNTISSNQPDILVDDNIVLSNKNVEGIDVLEFQTGAYLESQDSISGRVVGASDVRFTLKNSAVGREFARMNAAEDVFHIVYGGSSPVYLHNSSDDNQNNEFRVYGFPTGLSQEYGWLQVVNYNSNPWFQIATTGTGVYIPENVSISKNLALGTASVPINGTSVGNLNMSGDLFMGGAIFYYSPAINCFGGNWCAYTYINSSGHYFNDKFQMTNDYNLITDRKNLPDFVTEKIDRRKNEITDYSDYLKNRSACEDDTHSYPSFEEYRLGDTDCSLDCKISYQYESSGSCVDNIYLKCMANKTGTWDYDNNICIVDDIAVCLEQQDMTWNGSCVLSVEKQTERLKDECFEDKSKYWDGDSCESVSLLAV